MPKEPPNLIEIEHDDYHASHVGRTADGCQFFLTTPFVPGSRISAGREFVAFYLFDSKGSLLDALIDDLGTRAELDEERANGVFEQRLAELGRVDYCRIKVQPFQLERFDTTFGLVLCPPEEDYDYWRVEVQPGNYMAFHEPWDSGDYDT